MSEFLENVMAKAVDHSLRHVEQGGLPFVGVIVENGRLLSGYGVNHVHESRDSTAHAEIEAIRDALAKTGRETLSGTVLLATGEPCGMCYRFALEAGIRDIRVAVDRAGVAKLGFDYLSSYPRFGITDRVRDEVMSPLPVAGDEAPFTRYLELHP